MDQKELPPNLLRDLDEWVTSQKLPPIPVNKSNITDFGICISEALWVLSKKCGYLSKLSDFDKYFLNLCCLINTKVVGEQGGEAAGLELLAKPAKTARGEKKKHVPAEQEVPKPGPASRTKRGPVAENKENVLQKKGRGKAQSKEILVHKVADASGDLNIREFKGCSCKSDCNSKICGCKKSGLECTNSCKQFKNVCMNRTKIEENKKRKESDKESDGESDGESRGVDAV